MHNSCLYGQVHDIGLPEPPPWPINSLTIDLAKMCDLVDFWRIKYQTCRIGSYLQNSCLYDPMPCFVFLNIHSVIVSLTIDLHVAKVGDLCFYWLILSVVVVLY